MANKTPFKIDKNGTKYYVDYTCRKCGGAGGSEAWRYTGYTCYRCSGTGEDPKPMIWKEYTPEYEAKLQARRERKAEKKLMEDKAHAPEKNQQFFQKNGFTSEGKTYFILGKTFDIKDQLKAEGAKWDPSSSHWHMDHPFNGYPYLELSIEKVYTTDAAGVYTWIRTDYEESDNYYNLIQKAENDLRSANSTSNYLGNEGDKLTLKVTHLYTASFDNHFGYRESTSYIHSFKDEAGNQIIWKTSNPIPETSIFIITGTVKGYKEYKGIKQTILTRCKLEEVK